MDLKNLNIEFSSALKNINEVNPSFDAARLRIAYTGKNRNNTFISKESFERAIPTMFNCPVVANYIRKKDEIGSHDGEFIKDKDGEVKYVNITQPVGLVPESAHWSWEEVEDNGVIHQYLCTDVILWKRQEAYEHIKENGITKQSMEISVTNGEMLDDYYDIKDFCFTAFCLLGSAEPCFESAALFTFEKDEFKQQYTEMLNEFKAVFSTAEIIKKEEKENLKLTELLEKYQVKVEDLDFEYEGLSDEELETKFAEKFAQNPKAEDFSDKEEADPDDDSDPELNDNVDDFVDGENEPAGESDDYALNSQMRENLYEAISAAEQIETDWGVYPRFFMIDYDQDVSEVYFIDSEDYKLYGTTFAMDGDDVVVDFKCKKRKKYSIVDYVEGIEQNFEMFKLINAFNDKYAEMKVDADEFKRLKKFESDVLAEQRKTKEDALFEKFDKKFNNNEEYEALKSKASEYELDALEKELFALVGKLNFSAEKPEEVKSKSLPGIVYESESKNSGVRKLFAWKEEK